jgi:hypothetical protein
LGYRERLESGSGPLTTSRSSSTSNARRPAAQLFFVNALEAGEVVRRRGDDVIVLSDIMQHEIIDSCATFICGGNLKFARRTTAFQVKLREITNLSVISTYFRANSAYSQIVRDRLKAE